MPSGLFVLGRDTILQFDTDDICPRRQRFGKHSRIETRRENEATARPKDTLLFFVHKIDFLVIRLEIFRKLSRDLLRSQRF